MIEIEKLATNLVLTPDGLWSARNLSPVSYPTEGNAFCYQVEESSFWFRHRNRCILQLLNIFPPAGTVFDIGGGNGFVAAALNQAGVETVLVEPGDGVYNALRRGVPAVIHATLQDAGFLPSVLPAAGMFDVLEHIEDDFGFLRALASLLQPGGRLYLTVPAFGWLWSKVDEDSGHYRRYSPKALQGLLEKAGFQVEYLSGFFRLLVWPIFLFRALPSRLRLRKNEPVEALRGELTQSSRLVNAALSALLERELPTLGKCSFAWGASCIAVARRL